ncbi:MAG TPA: DUF5668 domain-containing protein [Burkholderiales bacterium]|nr:DUF5668 domain-containing protein [Burkholderiales bacterium]
MSAGRRNVVWSITLIVVGSLFLAYNLGYLRFSQISDLISTWWPVILIALGIAGLVSRA